MKMRQKEQWDEGCLVVLANLNVIVRAISSKGLGRDKKV